MKYDNQHATGLLKELQQMKEAQDILYDIFLFKESDRGEGSYIDEEITTKVDRYFDSL